MRAGELRERVQLQDPPAVDDAAGGQTGGWTDVGTPIAAAVEALAGEEAQIAGVETATARYRVIIRRRAVTTGQRLLWLGLALDVRATLPKPRAGTVVLLCEAVPA